MRADFVLPAVLVVALAAMAVYATTADEKTVAPELATSPATCTNGALVARMKHLPEASGLAASRRDANLFWSHNDSAEPVVFAVGADGAIRGRVRIAGATVRDWEALAAGPCPAGNCLYVGDIGDNDTARPSIIVYRAPEPAVGDEASAAAETIEGVYPEGPQDAEALFLSGDALFVITKGEKSPIRIYRFPTLEAGSRQTLQLVTTLTPDGADKRLRITDAATSPDNRWVALRSNEAVLFFDAKSLTSGQPGTPLSYDVRGLSEPQGEGLAWADAQTLYLAGEDKDRGGTLARLTCTLPH